MSSYTSQLALPLNLPECWNDEVRMNVLFAPFRNRSVNPQDWDSKITFWKNFITQCCVDSKLYTFTLEDLQKVLTKDGRHPGCLNVVVDEMFRNGDLQQIDSFLQAPAQTWAKWVTDKIIKKPLFWSYEKIKDTLISPTKNIVFVNVSAVKSDCAKMLSSIPQELQNKVLNLQELLDILKLENTRAGSIKLLLHYLACDNQADFKEVASNFKEVPLQNVLIKFGDMKKVKPISDTDIGVYILEQNEKALSKNLEKMEEDSLKIIQEAKMYLSKGQRQMAKASLRKKHELENRVTKKANTLHNVQTLLLRVKETDNDAQVLDSYKTVLSTLKTTFKETGLSEDAVVDTITELGELLDIHEDIQATLAQPLTNNDDDDLEKELAELMVSNDKFEPPKPPSPLKPTEDEETENLEERLRRLRLPEIPSNSPPIKSQVLL